jgi:hypothetical protein
MKTVQVVALVERPHPFCSSVIGLTVIGFVERAHLSNNPVCDPISLGGRETPAPAIRTENSVANLGRYASNMLQMIILVSLQPPCEI